MAHDVTMTSWEPSTSTEDLESGHDTTHVRLELPDLKRNKRTRNSYPSASSTTSPDAATAFSPLISPGRTVIENLSDNNPSVKGQTRRRTSSASEGARGGGARSSNGSSSSPGGVALDLGIKEKKRVSFPIALHKAIFVAVLLVVWLGWMALVLWASFVDVSMGTGPDSTEELSVETLHRAYTAVLLSQLAYRSPIQVEYLRRRANNESEEDVLKTIHEQAPGQTPEIVRTEVASMEQRTETFKPVLSRFDQPSKYFDGKQSLFLQATMAYMFFCPSPPGTPNILWVAFRGTEDGEDIVADARISQVEIKPKPLGDAHNPIADIPCIKIHQGYRDQYLAVSTALTRDVEAAAREVAWAAPGHFPGGPARLKDMIKAKVRCEQEKEEDPELNDGGFEVILTGHSMGAALATIGSFVAAVEHPDVKVSYFGFGSPRVGNAAFAKAYARALQGANGHVYHFENRRDIVPAFPSPRTYLHVGGRFMIDEGVKGRPTAIRLSDEKKGFKTVLRWCKSSLAFFGWSLVRSGKVDHKVSIYVERVKALYMARAGQLGSAPNGA